jgi:hypothetical protein
VAADAHRSDAVAPALRANIITWQGHANGVIFNRFFGGMFVTAGTKI